mgnify:CR=1 FL=1
MISEKLKELRKNQNLTQSDIAKKLGITRSSVNAWELGISIPSTRYIVELSELFGVSADYLLGIPETSTVNVDGLSEKEVGVIKEIIECLKNKKWLVVMIDHFFIEFFCRKWYYLVDFYFKKYILRMLKNE